MGRRLSYVFGSEADFWASGQHKEVDGIGSKGCLQMFALPEGYQRKVISWE